MAPSSYEASRPQGRRRGRLTMRNKITRLQWLIQRLAELDDDLSRPWQDYPCLEWPFYRLKSGYGKAGGSEISFLYAHRESFKTAKGTIPDGSHVCHHCDNPPCFRPIHLFADTQDGNIQDAVAKGRMKHGSNHYKAKFSDSEVLEMRAIQAEGWTFARIAERFNTDISTVSDIVHGKNWKHLPFASEIRTNRKILSRQAVDSIVALGASDLCHREIAMQFGVTRSAISTLLRRHAIDVLPAASANTADCNVAQDVISTLNLLDAT